MNKQIELLCKKLKAHSVSLVYTPCNGNIANLHVHAVWQPWQIIARHIDDSQTFFRFSKTAQEAIDFAVQKTKYNQALDSDDKKQSQIS